MIIATAIMTPEEYREAGLTPDVAEGCGNCDHLGRDRIKFSCPRACRRVLDLDLGTLQEFEYRGIAAMMEAAGATTAEADGLADILAAEGWGGREFLPETYSRSGLAERLAWYREFRA